jgi:hypothetical protein
MPIDDPLDQTLQQNRVGLSPVVALALKAAASIFSFDPAAGAALGVSAALYEHFSAQGLEARFTAMFEAVRDRCHELEGRIETMETSFQTPAAIDPLIAAINETTLTNNPRKVQRFAWVLAGTAVKGQSWQEAESFIHDLARLTDEDVKALALLARTQEELAVDNLMPTDPNPYTGNFAELADEIDRADFRREEFYAISSRLVGFGLAAAVERNIMIMSLRDQGFRITSRGLRLARLIQEDLSQKPRRSLS